MMPSSRLTGISDSGGAAISSSGHKSTYSITRHRPNASQSSIPSTDPSSSILKSTNGPDSTISPQQSLRPGSFGKRDFLGGSSSTSSIVTFGPIRIRKARIVETVFVMVFIGALLLFFSAMLGMGYDAEGAALKKAALGARDVGGGGGEVVDPRAGAWIQQPSQNGSSANGLKVTEEGDEEDYSIQGGRNGKEQIIDGGVHVIDDEDLPRRRGSAQVYPRPIGNPNKNPIIQPPTPPRPNLNGMNPGFAARVRGDTAAGLGKAQGKAQGQGSDDVIPPAPPRRPPSQEANDVPVPRRRIEDYDSDFKIRHPDIYQPESPGLDTSHDNSPDLVENSPEDVRLDSEHAHNHAYHEDDNIFDQIRRRRRPRPAQPDAGVPAGAADAESGIHANSEEEQYGSQRKFAHHTQDDDEEEDDDEDENDEDNEERFDRIRQALELGRDTPPSGRDREHYAEYDDFGERDRLEDVIVRGGGRRDGGNRGGGGGGGRVAAAAAAGAGAGAGAGAAGGRVETVPESEQMRMQIVRRPDGPAVVVPVPVGEGEPDGIERLNGVVVGDEEEDEEEEEEEEEEEGESEREEQDQERRK